MGPLGTAVAISLTLRDNNFVSAGWTGVWSLFGLKKERYNAERFVK